MYCKNCGTDNLDTARFCVGCGTELSAPVEQPVYQEPAYQEPVYQEPVYQEQGYQEQGYQEYQDPYQAPVEAEPQKEDNFFDKAVDFGKNYVEEAKTDKKKLLIPIIAGAATILLIVVLIIAFSGGYKDALDPYEKLLNGKGDADTVEDIMPEDFWNYAEEEGDMTPSDVYDLVENGIDDLLEDAEEEFGEDVKFSFKVLEKKELSTGKLNDLKDNYKEVGMAKKELTKAYRLTVEITVKGDFDEESEEFDVVVFKYDGDWYVDVLSLASMVDF